MRTQRTSRIVAGRAGCPQPAANPPEPQSARNKLPAPLVSPRLLCFCLLLSGFCFPVWAQYSLDWSTIDGGGGTSTGGVYIVSGTIGQADAGATMSGGNYSLAGGFWSLLSVVQTPGAPLLSIFRTTTNTLAVAWPSPSTGWTLQQNANSVSSLNWSNVTSGIQDDGTTRSLIVSPPIGNRFYRRRGATVAPPALDPVVSE